jgi:hypothetical protein
MGSMGRLGNQMFQYACAYAVAKRNNTSLSISTYNLYTKNPVNQIVETFKLSSALHNDYTGIVHQFYEADFSYDPRIENVTNGTDLVGYFQSDRYFSQYRNELLENEFVFNSDLIDRAAVYTQSLKLCGELCSIHVRMGDYKKLSDTHTNLGKDYYTRALSLVPDCKSYIVFSDEPAEAKKMFEQISTKNSQQFLYPDLDYGTSLYLMSICNHHIIANSSYSWWGAWLSTSKTVVAPSSWFGSNGPKRWCDVYCSGWKTI